MLKRFPSSMLRVFLSVLLILRMNIKFILMNLKKLVLERFLIHMVLSFIRLRANVGLIMGLLVVLGLFPSRVLLIIISGLRKILMNSIMR